MRRALKWEDIGPAELSFWFESSFAQVKEEINDLGKEDGTSHSRIMNGACYPQSNRIACSRYDRFPTWRTAAEHWTRVYIAVTDIAVRDFPIYCASQRAVSCWASRLGYKYQPLSGVAELSQLHTLKVPRAFTQPVRRRNIPLGSC